MTLIAGALPQMRTKSLAKGAGGQAMGGWLAPETLPNPLPLPIPGRAAGELMEPRLFPHLLFLSGNKEI